MTTAVLDISTLDSELRLGVKQLSELGFGHPVTVRERMIAGDIPAVKVGGVWKVRVGDLPAPSPAKPTAEGAINDPAASESAEGLDDLADLAARMVATWPRLSPERKAALGKLLAAA